MLLHARHYISICRLHIHRHFNHTLFFKRDSGQSQAAFLRAWEPFYNMADTWALLRAVEGKYGKIVEARFPKDKEIKDRYQMQAYLLFQDQESIRRIPEDSQGFHILAPAIEIRPGGFGLDDIKHLLESTDRDESFEFPPVPSRNEKKPKGRIIGFQIERAPKNYYTFSTAFSDFAEETLAREFLMWGGFHRLVPMEVLERTKEDVWFGKPSSQQMAMRVALQRCSELTGLRNIAVRRRRSVYMNDGEVSDSSPGSAPMDSPESSSPTMLTAHKNDGKVSDSSSGSASMDSPESSSQTTLDIPISNESTSKSTQSRSLLTEFPRPPSQSPPELTQLPPEPTPPPEPTIPSPGQQLSPEQLQEQKSKAKQLVVNKRRAAKEARKPEKEPEERLEDQNSLVPVKFLEKPLQSQSMVAKLRKLLGRWY